MKTMAGTTSGPREVLQPKEAARNNEAFAELGRGVQAELETYHALITCVQNTAVGTALHTRKQAET